MTAAGPTHRVGVFCGAKPGLGPGFLDVATEVGLAIGRARAGLVYGGSAGGLMGAVADAVMSAGGHVVGVIPRHLVEHDPIKADIHECHVVETMHERKSMMYRLADSFVVLPGGFGTLDELFEILTWRKLGQHGKPIVLLNVAGYYDHLVRLVDHATAAGFLSPADRDLLRTADSVPAAMSLVAPVPLA